VALLEVLIAVFVFSIGMLGIIAAQAQGGKIVFDAQLRTEAAAAADELLARIRMSDPATRAARFSTGGPDYQTWFDERLEAGGRGLPGADAEVAFGVVGGDPRTVRITVRWSSRDRVRANTGDRVEARTHQHVTVSAVYD
jgi:hypothetical protein